MCVCHFAWKVENKVTVNNGHDSRSRTTKGKTLENLEVRFSLAEDKAPFYSAADRFSRYLFVCSILVMNCLI